MDWSIILPYVFATLMGISILAYVILDGFDLGVGLLFHRADAAEKDQMVASIGPFWDGNETWLVLAVGLLLVAFPLAHGQVLEALYLPVFIMLVGLVFRGIAFEIRHKCPPGQKPLWNFAFFAGSAMTALSQGFMLGMYILGLEWTIPNVAFSMLIAPCLAAGYVLVGACWVIHKSEGVLHDKAISWAKTALIGACVGLFAVSLATPLASEALAAKWIRFPTLLYLSPLPIITIGLLSALWWTLDRLERGVGTQADWIPLALCLGLFVCAFLGMAYSFFPYIVPGELRIREAAAYTGSLWIILVGALFVLPMILAYTALSYWIFRGKATNLSYGHLTTE